jgi:hypothetical protein
MADAPKRVRRKPRGPEPQEVEINHKTLLTAFMSIFEIAPSVEGAFDARLKHTLRQFLPPVVKGRRQTPNRRHSLADVFGFALAMQLQRAFVTPTDAAQFVMREQGTMVALFVRCLVRQDGYMLQLPLNAFASIGAASPRSVSSAVTAGHAVLARGMAQSRAMPLLTIDVGELADRLATSLTEAGVRSADIEVSIANLSY